MQSIDLTKRSNEIELEEYWQIVKSKKDLIKIVDTIPLLVLILNKNRQAIYYNKKLYEDLNAKSYKDIIGKRPGEMFSCIHAFVEPTGCGNSPFCKYCGALNAILKSYEFGTKTDFCRLTTSTDGVRGSMDLEVTASAIEIKEQECTLFVIKDISDYNRRIYLERIFFHDLSNTAGAIVTTTDMIKSEDDSDAKEELIELLVPAANQLLNEITAQQEIQKAERGDWSPDISTSTSLALIYDCLSISNNYIFDDSVKLVVSTDAVDFETTTELTLLKRVLLNMLKNAIEASISPEIITIKCYTDDNEMYIFSVNNQRFIPEDIRMQLFQRSYSTKGKGRGVGTYSMRLLAENYLKGSVTVTSTKAEGTTFTVMVPKIEK
ncbi:MAG: hypothetical protein B6226_05695 [Candidatus Cloacimonetes bacterium 4572_65]|nr:MAG: hypothetical protein B6226_05695 [Candidatus Cloacimonetes bacterium 4572_65]